MTATTHSTGDEPRENPGEDTPLGAHEITPEQDAGAVFVGVASHLCTNCGAVLATDQKYCVECGTRRGTPRFRVAEAVQHHNLQAQHHLHAPTVPAPAAGISTRLLALLALIVVIAAIAVGFLIGNSSSSTTVHITGLTGGAVSSTSGSASSGGAKTSKSGTSKGSSSSSGTGCSAGTPGCKNGKQTGNFFSG